MDFLLRCAVSTITVAEVRNAGTMRIRLVRRQFGQLTAVGLWGAIFNHFAGKSIARSKTQVEPKMTRSNQLGSLVDVTLRVNGKEQHLKIEPQVTLLDALRERLELPGTKKGCDHGQCGACTVLINGRRVNSCLTFAIMHRGSEIKTVEGLSSAENLHPVQAAFVANDAFQCGYCTPGQICSAVGLLNEGHAKTKAEIRELMSGNICRCGAYPNIVNAVNDVLEGQKNAAI